MQPKINTPDEDLLVDSNSAVELRAQRVWRLVFVMWFAWSGFAVFYWAVARPDALLISAAASFAHLTLMVLHRNKRNYQLIMTLNMMVGYAGLLGIAIRIPELSDSIQFLPIGILVAFQLFGVRAAFFWLVSNILATTLVFVATNSWDACFQSPLLEKLTLMLGVPTCLFACCQQGELFYQERTRNLFKLSQNLQKRSRWLGRLVSTDELTSIDNRYQFRASLKDSVQRAIASSGRAVLFLIDMDGFKGINDTLGHAIGDAALVEIAKRLTQEFLPDNACVARLGGDEFCIVAENISNAEADAMAVRIRENLTQRYHLKEAGFHLGASVGYAICPDHSQSDSELLAYADTAMYFAKENNIGQACYEKRMTDCLVEHQLLQEKLSYALERDEFALVYQPQVDLRSGLVIGVEALLRWHHEGEVIPPYRFIHLLEQSREIIPVSQWVLRESCRQLALWHGKGHDIELSVNVSAVQFKDKKFAEKVAECVREFGVDAKKLDFEITEGLLIDDVADATEKLNQIKDLGASISVDDFGTGYSSLAYLQQFPIDRLKIDRAFIKDIPNDDDGVIAASVVVLAKTLGLKVLAEGAETEAHIEFLKSHDCDEYQGYFLSRPVPADQVEKYFNRPLVPVSGTA